MVFCHFLIPPAVMAYWQAAVCGVQSNLGPYLFLAHRQWSTNNMISTWHPLKRTLRSEDFSRATVLILSPCFQSRRVFRTGTHALTPYITTNDLDRELTSSTFSHRLYPQSVGVVWTLLTFAGVSVFYVCLLNTHVRPLSGLQRLIVKCLLSQ